MADPFIGRKIDVGIAKEGTRGTGVAPTFWIPVSSFGFQERAEKAISEVSYSHIAQHSTAVLVDQFAQGNLEGEIRTESFGLLMLALLGTDTPAAYDTSAFTHAFTLDNDNLHQSLTISYKDDVRDIWFKNAMMKSMKITIVPNDIVKYQTEFESIYPGTHSAFTSSYADCGARFRGRDLTFKVAATTGALAASTAISLKSLTINFVKDLVRDNVCGTLGAEDIFNTIFRVEMEAVLNFTSETYLDYAHLDGDMAVGIDLTNVDTVIGAGAGRNSLYFEFPKVIFTQWERSDNLDDIVSQTVQMEPVYDPALGKLISSCYLRNETATY